MLDNKISLEDKIELTFEYFTQQISNYKNQDFVPTFKEKKEIQNFAILLKERYFELSLGSTWFFEYFSFQFEYWRTKESRYYKGLAKLSWVIGPKAFTRWLNKSNDYLYWCRTGVLFFNKSLHKGDIDKLFNNKINISFLNKDNITQKNVEEIEKKIYLNTKQGFIHCLNVTTLFNNQSLTCLKCKFKNNCKLLLQNNYPNIYKERGYV